MPAAEALGDWASTVSMSLSLSFLFSVKEDCWLLLGSLIWICIRKGCPEKQNQYYTYTYMSTYAYMYICVYSIEKHVYIPWGRYWLIYLIYEELFHMIVGPGKSKVCVAWNLGKSWGCCLESDCTYSSRLETWAWFLCFSFEENFFLFWKSVFSLKAFNRLDEAHPHYGGDSALLRVY